MNKTLLIAGALLAATQAQATANSNMDISINWNSLVITGPLGSLTNFYDPFMNATFYSDSEGWVGSYSTELDWRFAINGASAIASYTDSTLDLVGGYDSAVNESGSTATINNDAGNESGWAGSWQGFIYQASGTGAVTVSVDYSLIGSVSTDSVSEYAGGGYNLFMDATDTDIWLSTYNDAVANGLTDLAAEDAAELAATLHVITLSDWSLLECVGITCNQSTNQSGTLELAFNVEAGRNYSFGASANVFGYTNVSAVPVPAAVWLFGSGLIGLVGFAKRRNNS